MFKGEKKMSVEIFNGERSEESVQFEKWLISQSNKKVFLVLKIPNGSLSKGELKIFSAMLLGMILNF